MVTHVILGTVNFFIFVGVGALCVLWVMQQNVASKLTETLFDEAFSGDGYEPNCEPKVSDDGKVKFGQFDPCTVHVTVMSMVFTEKVETDTDEFKIVVAIMAVSVIEAIIQLIMVVL